MSFLPCMIAAASSSASAPTLRGVPPSQVPVPKTNEHVLLRPGTTCSYQPPSNKNCCLYPPAHTTLLMFGKNDRWRANFQPTATWAMVSQAPEHNFASIPNSFTRGASPPLGLCFSQLPSVHRTTFAHCCTAHTIGDSVAS